MGIPKVPDLPRERGQQRTEVCPEQILAARLGILLFFLLLEDGRLMCQK